MQFRFRREDDYLGTCPLTGRRILPGEEKHVHHHEDDYLLMVHRHANWGKDEVDDKRYLRTFQCDACNGHYKSGSQHMFNDSTYCGCCYAYQRRQNKAEQTVLGKPGADNRVKPGLLDKPGLRDRPLNFEPLLDPAGSLLAHAWKFYTLRMLETAINPYSPENYSSHARTKLYQDIQWMKTEHTERLGRRMYNYIISASVGEARHVFAHFEHCYLQINNSDYKYDPDWLHPKIEFLFDLCDETEGEICGHYVGRGEIGCKLNGGSHLRQHSVNDFTRAMLDLFNRRWKSGFGGYNWAMIVNALPLYHQNQEVFIDHAFDLQHNGGCAFNKGDIFSHCESGILRPFLDLKRDAIDADDYIIKIAEHWKRFLKGYAPTFSLCCLASELRQLITRAHNLGLVSQEVDLNYDLQFSSRFISHGVYPMEEGYFQQQEERYRSYRTVYSAPLDKWLYWQAMHPQCHQTKTLAAAYKQQHEQGFGPDDYADVPF